LPWECLRACGGEGRSGQSARRIPAAGVAVRGPAGRQCLRRAAAGDFRKAASQPGWRDLVPVKRPASLPSSQGAGGLTRRMFLRNLSAGYLALAAPALFPGLASKRQHMWMQGAAAPANRALFEDVPASNSGISFHHVNGRSPEYYLPETTGAGCAFLDYDNDGWMDIYLVNSGKCDFYDPQPPLRNALYRNNRDGTFTDVTEKAGVAGGGYGMGVAVGDYDGDGQPDLYVTQYGRNILYHNN